MLSNKIKPSLFVALFGASSGWALILGNSLIPAWLTSMNVDLTTIGMLGLVSLPYMFKFLWAPIFDRYSFLRMPQVRGWLFCIHMVLATCSVCLSFMHNVNLYTLWPLLLVLGFFAASLDVVVDSHRASISEVTLSQKNALYVFCYRIAMMLSGVCLIFADHFGWQASFLLVAFCFALGGIFTLGIPAQISSEKSVSVPAFKAGWQDFLSRNHSMAILGFVLFYKIGIGFALSMNTPFILRELQFSLTDIGVIQKGLGFVANMLGVFLGSLIINRITLPRSLYYFLIFETLAISQFAMMAWLPPSYAFLAFSVAVEQLTSGMATVALLSFIMQQANPLYKSAQLALLTSIMAFGRVLVAPFSGTVIDNFGWGTFYLLAILLSLPAFYFLRRLTVSENLV